MASNSRPAMALFDAHCHLQDPRIAHCLPNLIRSASEAGVRWFAVNGTSQQDWEAVKKMGEDYPAVIPCFGLHPWYVEQRSEDWLHSLRAMFELVPHAAVGEIGLDMGARGKQIDKDLQVNVFKEQLHLARELHRPAAIHCVRAFDPLQKALREMGSFPEALILHSYLGSAEIVDELIKHNAYFSFSGFFTSLKETKAKRILAKVPLDRILLETDAPDALPQVDPNVLSWVPEIPAVSETEEENVNECDSGKRIRNNVSKTALNHPANIYAVLSFVSSMKAIPESELATASHENARRLFSYPGSKLL